MNAKQEIDLAKAFMQKSAMYLQEAFERLDLVTNAIEEAQKTETAPPMPAPVQKPLQPEEEMAEDIYSNEQLNEREEAEQEARTPKGILKKVFSPKAPKYEDFDNTPTELTKEEIEALQKTKRVL